MEKSKYLIENCKKSGRQWWKCQFRLVSGQLTYILGTDRLVNFLGSFWIIFRPIDFEQNRFYVYTTLCTINISFWLLKFNKSSDFLCDSKPLNSQVVSGRRPICSFRFSKFSFCKNDGLSRTWFSLNWTSELRWNT